MPETNTPERPSGPPVKIGPITIRKSWFKRVTIAFLAFMAFPWLMAWISCSAQHGCGAGCKPDPTPVVLHPIDAGTHAIDVRIDAATVQAEHRIQQLEADHRAAVEAFTAQQRAEYEAVRSQGPEAVEAWFNAWYAQERQRP
jgi:hypothetical protein